MQIQPVNVNGIGNPNEILLLNLFFLPNQHNRAARTISKLDDFRSSSDPWKKYVENFDPSVLSLSFKDAFSKKESCKKSPRKKKVKRVNEFSFATKRWPHVESRRHAPLRAACSTRAPFRGAATRKNVNEEEEKMGYEERRRSESVTCLDLSIDRFGNFSRGKTFETNARFLYRRID